jgi:hypothetical protein
VPGSNPGFAAGCRRYYVSISRADAEVKMDDGAVSIDSVISPARDVIHSNLADEIVLLDLKSGVYHGLEAVGARIWELLASPVSVRQVRDTLLEEYDVDSHQCEQDLLQLIEELRNHGLVEVRSQASG